MTKYNNTPLTLLLFTALAILGAFFPVYGITIGGVKLTVFRMGVFPLLISQYGSLFKYNQKLVYAIVVFFIIRLITIVWTDDVNNGIKQLFWFFEGSCLLFSTNAAFNKYTDYGKWFFRLTLTIGAISIFFIFLQAVCYFGMGYKLYVPFTQNIPEIITGNQYWNYPIYGTGRIVGPFYEPNMAGSMCCYFFALVFPFVMRHNMKNGKWLVIPLIIIVIASLFTGSRQSAVGIVICIVVYFAYFAKNKTKTLFVFGVIISIFSFFLINNWDSVSVLFDESENVFSRFSESSGGADDSDFSGGRFSYVEKVWEKYGVSHFFFGAGEGVTHGGGHNVFLAVFLENGIFALIAFITMLWKLWYTSLLNYKRNSMPICISSCLIIISWVFLMFVNWAQLNQSLSFIYIGFVLSSLSKHNKYSLS